MRSSRSRRMSGPRLTTQTSRSGTGLGSRTSPACWTCPPGRPGCGSSSARSARTRGRSCGHRPRRAPVHRVRHRRQERPARGPGTAAPPPGPLREGSAAPRTPGCGTCHLKGFAHNQLRCEIVALACELLAWTQLLALAGRPAGGSPGACGCACSPSRGAWSAAAAACGSASPHAGAGPARSPPRSSACRPSLPDVRTHYPAMAGSCQA